MRRLVWLAFLCFVLLLTVTGCTEPQQGVEGNLRWSLDRWGTMTIEGEGPIPRHDCHDWAAHSAERDWDAALAQATRLVISEGITEIGQLAFHCLPRLKTAELPEGLTRIGDYAFFSCPKLKNIVLPDSITEIGRQAFSYCDSLTELRIPAGVTQMPSDIIVASDKVRKIYLPVGLERIEGLRDCPSLEEILVDEGNPNLISRDGVVFSADGTILLAYPAGKKDKVYTVPEGVIEIGLCAFAHAERLTKVVLPEGVRTIGRGGFADCAKLCTVHLPHTLETIETYAFDNCYDLEDIRFPDSLTSMGEGAFISCSGLQEINLPPQLTEIADNLFQDCISLTSITFPETLTHIGKAAFWGCHALTEVHIPASVQTIDLGAFAYCSQLSTFTVDAGNPAYIAIDGVLCSADGKTLVSYPIGREDVVYRVPEGIVHIASYSFYRADELETVVLADSVMTMGEDAFACCAKLAVMTIPPQMTELPRCAFISCWNLQTITLPEGLQKIGNSAFCNTESMAQVRFAGTEAQWAAVEIGDDNESLAQAEIIFGAAQEP